MCTSVEDSGKRKRCKNENVPVKDTDIDKDFTVKVEEIDHESGNSEGNDAKVAETHFL